MLSKLLHSEDGRQGHDRTKSYGIKLEDDALILKATMTSGVLLLEWEFECVQLGTRDHQALFLKEHMYEPHTEMLKLLFNSGYGREAPVGIMPSKDRFNLWRNESYANLYLEVTDKLIKDRKPSDSHQNRPNAPKDTDSKVASLSDDEIDSVQIDNFEPESSLANEVASSSISSIASNSASQSGKANEYGSVDDQVLEEKVEGDNETRLEREQLKRRELMKRMLEAQGNKKRKRKKFV